MMLALKQHKNMTFKICRFILKLKLPKQYNLNCSRIENKYPQRFIVGHFLKSDYPFPVPLKFKLLYCKNPPKKKLKSKFL